MATDAKTATPWTTDILLEVLANTSEGILLLRQAERGPQVLYANLQVTRVCGFSEQQLLQDGWASLFGTAQTNDPVRLAISGSESYRGNHEIFCSDGSILQVGIRLRELNSALDDESLWLLQIQSAGHAVSGNDGTAGPWGDSEQIRHRERFGRLDKIDGSSGLLRFERFQDFLDRDLAIAWREKLPVSLMALKVLEFDQYRATFGDNAADSCLRMIGKQVTATLRRATDLCARYEDDTILIAVFGQDSDHAASLLTKIRDNIDGLKIHNPRGRHGRYLCVSSAIITAQSDAAGRRTSEDLLAHLTGEIENSPKAAESR